MTRTAFPFSDGCISVFDWCFNVSVKGRLLKRRKRTAMPAVRSVLTILLLLVVVFQLIPACPFASGAPSESIRCCQTKCPSRLSGAPASCCKISATLDEGISSTSAMPQASVVHLATTAHLFRLHRVSASSWSAHRSLAPPQNSFGALCSRQI